jgi:potassium uptake TrkH family protein
MSLQSIREQINLALYDSKHKVLSIFKMGSFVIASLIQSMLIYQFGFETSTQTNSWIILSVKSSLIFYILKYLADVVYSYEPLKFIKSSKFEGLLLLFILINALSSVFFDQSLLKWLGYKLELFQLENFYLMFIQFYFFIILGIEITKISTKISFLKMNPAQMLITSFGLLITIGTGFLMMPEMTTEVDNMPFFDALFTSISASCVTGLIIVDTATYFSQKGHIVIMALIQLGGLNIISFATLFAIFSKKGLGIKHQTILQESFSSESLLSSKGLLRKVFLFSLFIEIIGMILIYFSWSPDIKFDHLEDQLFYSVFHSISAYNNAGFTLFTDGLFNTMLNGSYSMHLIIALLIILGAIGFPVIEDILSIKRLKKALFKRNFGFKLNTRISLYTSVVLIIMGMIMFYFLEQNNTLNNMSIYAQLTTSFFQSVTRTAGFNTVDIALVGTPMLLIFIFLMFIGGAPGSFGGGIKTSTFTLIIFSALNTIRGKKNIEIERRSIPSDLVHKAFSIFLFAASSIFIAIFILSISDGNQSLLPLAFEAVSAFSTVGLSTGITSDLSVIGKSVLMLCMFVGRVGTLTLAFALNSKMKSSNYKYPRAHMMIG